MNVGDKVLMISLEFSMISHYVTLCYSYSVCGPLLTLLKSVLSSDF